MICKNKFLWKFFDKINDLKVISTLIKVKAISVNCIFLSCHIGVSEWIHILQLPECPGTPCSKQVQNMKFKWLQWD